MNLRTVAVIDTNVLISALRSNRGGSHEVIRRVGTGRFETALSVPLLLEYEEVVHRTREYVNRSVRQINDILDYLCSVCSLHKVHYLWRPFLADADDDMVLELAVAANATHIVTHNVRDFRGCERFAISVITPGDFLKLLGERS
jgi:putative PIN family toxin of toxin-antitoxin system